MLGSAAPRWFHPIAGVGHAAQAEAEDVLVGRFRLFSQHMVDAGSHPQWSYNPLTGDSAPHDKHWSRLGDFAYGDIKGIWEMSRFGWAFALGRAYARTCDDRYADRFWRLFEGWLDGNPPNCGPNWMCGQEATFRMMAVVWASDVLRDAAASTPTRIAQVELFVIATARRISANLDYALSQSNNHGVSECVGLITAGLRLEGAVGVDDIWTSRGWRELERQLAELVYADGGFSQQSAVYHRVLLHDLLWLIAILRRTGRSVPNWLAQAAQRALTFLDVLMNPVTGRVPLYGPNDGANILPLADADFLDFRPTVQAGYALLIRGRRLPLGPWDEAAYWLAPTGWDHRNLDVEAEPQLHFPNAGVLMWKTGELRVFCRCPMQFRHRPAQADMLHVDVEWRGEPIAHDAGTFSYNTLGVFCGALKEAAVHNTVTVDGAEPLEKVGRFLYLPWPGGRALWEQDSCEFVAEHDGWRRLGVRHERRLARVGPATLIVTDRIRGRVAHRARVHWLLADVRCEFRAEASELVLYTASGPFRLTWNAPAARASLVRADPYSTRGWWSPYYDLAAPALSLVIEFEFTGLAEVVTKFEPVASEASKD